MRMGVFHLIHKLYIWIGRRGGGVLDKRSSGDTRERTSLPFTGENSASCFLYKFTFRQKLTFKCLSQKQYHSFTNHSGIEKFTRVLSLLTTFSILLFFSSIHLYFYRVVTKKSKEIDWNAAIISIFLCCLIVLIIILMVA